MTATPTRIQRKRTKGWRLPEGAVYVGRPTILGNPFRPVYDSAARWVVLDDNGVDYQPRYDSGPSAQRKSVELFEEDLLYWFGGRISYDPVIAARITELAGRDLACWCWLDVPCHADVLLKLANGGTS